VDNGNKEKINSLDIYFKERKILRDELNSLKNCQVTFFTATVTATALILTVAAKVNPDSLPGIAYLFPLAIIVPTWIVFFDKALTISRIVGYYRILEELIVNEESRDFYEFIGWESSLKKFRAHENDPEFENFKKKVLESNFESKNRYWEIINYAYMALTGFCFFLAFISFCVCAFTELYTQAIAIFVIGILIGLFTLWVYSNNSEAIQSLRTYHSYDCNEKTWRKILKKNKNSVQK
jgi:hypothetical protein